MHGRDGALTTAVFAVLGMVASVVATSVFAAAPGIISLQGILKDASDIALPDATYTVTFRIYSADAGGSEIWSETSSITTADGLFTVLLGVVNPVPDTVFSNSNRWLGIQVSGYPEMIPRPRLTSVAYALGTGWVWSGDTVFRLNGKVGIGTAAPEAPLHVQQSSAGAVTAFGQSIAVLESNDHGFLSIITPNGLERGILFGQPSNATAGGVIYNGASTPNGLQFRINGNSIGAVIDQQGFMGIGATSPLAKLDVRGDIHLGPTGQYRATSGEENLRIVRGIVDLNGVTVFGTGFTVTHHAQGHFTVSFTESFSSTPSFTATPFFNSSPGFIVLRGVGSGSAEFNLCNAESTDLACHTFDAGFNFIAIGPR